MSDFSLKDFLEEIKKMETFETMIPEKLVSKESEMEWLSLGEGQNKSQIGIMPKQPSRTFELFFQEIPQNGSSDMQRHHHETIHYIISGNGYSEIAGRKVSWESGDCVYTPPWSWHRHYNASSTQAVKMLTIENSRLLKTLDLNRRESKGYISWHEMTGENPIDN